MNKRLVWNFEINTDQPLQLPGPSSIEPNQPRWESRFFWPDDQIITLRGLSNTFLELSQYQIKHREDTYYLLPNTNYNIKTRREQLFYKPIVMKKANAIAYGKKIKLEEHAANMPVPGCEEQDAQTLIAHIHSKGIKINVVKEALIYTFDTTPTTKLELAMLYVAKKAYFSVNIESRSIQTVELITQRLLGKVSTCDYVAFLRGSLK